MTTKTQKSPQEIIKTYKKANKNYRQSILKRYGISNIERINDIFTGSAEKKLTKTELASLLLENKGITLKVSFQKKTNEKDLLQELMTHYTYSSKHEVESKFKDSINSCLHGEERIATIHHSGKRDKFGNLFAVDENKPLLKKSYNTQMIVINLNNLNWLEINGIRYTKKK